MQEEKKKQGELKAEGGRCRSKQMIREKDFFVELLEHKKVSAKWVTPSQDHFTSWSSYLEQNLRQHLECSKKHISKLYSQLSKFSEKKDLENAPTTSSPKEQIKGA